MSRQKGQRLSGVARGGASLALTAYWQDLGAVGCFDPAVIRYELPWLVIAVGLERYLGGNRSGREDAWSALVSFLDRESDPAEQSSLASVLADLHPSFTIVVRHEGPDVARRAGPPDAAARRVDDTLDPWLARMRNAVAIREPSTRAVDVATALLDLAHEATRRRRQRFGCQVLASAAAALDEELDDRTGGLLHLQAGTIALWLTEIDDAADHFEIAREAAQTSADRTLIAACERAYRAAAHVGPLLDVAMAEVVEQCERLNELAAQYRHATLPPPDAQAIGTGL